MNDTPSTPDVDSPESLPPGAPKFCQNCGARLQGPHCYACGQPIKGAVRHFGSLMGDILDTIFEYDNRVWRTLGPLFFRPGYITNDYLAGRRVRYVTPFRLFFVISVLAFFLAQFAFDINDGEGVKVDTGNVVTINGEKLRIGDAMSVPEAERRRDAMMADFDKALSGLGDGPGVAGVRVGIEAGRKDMLREAEKRIAKLKAAEAAGEAPPAPEDDKPTLRFGGDEPWNAETNPIKVDWLGEGGNAWINQQIGRAEKNVARIQEEPDLLKEAVLSALPMTFFVLMPIFALLLKVAYVFKHRLYMEHLIVALHSHAFLSLALLMVAALSLLRGWSGWGAFGFLEALLMFWIPLYLLLMQKRVYRQGWPMTLLKFGVLGFVYFNLLGMSVVLTLLWALVWM